MRWWGYLHTNGSLQVKLYFGPQDIREAQESPFVITTYGPWDAKDRPEAIEKLEEAIKQHEN